MRSLPEKTRPGGDDWAIVGGDTKNFQLHIVSFNFSGAIIWSYFKLIALNTTRVSQGFGSFSSLFKIPPCQHLPMRKVKRSRTMMMRCMLVPTTTQSITVKTDFKPTSQPITS